VSPLSSHINVDNPHQSWAHLLPPVTPANGSVLDHFWHFWLCSQKTGFDKAWNRFAKALTGRGYTARQIKKAREDLDYTSRPSLIKKRKDKATDNSTEQKECPGVPIVVPHKPGVAQWWQDCKERDLTIGLRGLQQAEIAYLPGKGMLKCLSGTDNLGKLLKKG